MKRQIESLFLGFLAAIGALVLEILIFFVFRLSPESSPPTKILSTVSLILLIPVVIEEASKYLILVKRVEYFSFAKTMIYNSLIFGLGFSFFEVFLITKNSALLIQKNNIFEIFAIHILTCGILGSIIATKNPSRIMTAVSAILTTSFFHYLFNILAFFSNGIGAYAGYALISIMLIINVLNILLINRKLAY